MDTLLTALRPRSVATYALWYALSVVLSVAALVLMMLLRPLMEHSVFFLFLAADLAMYQVKAMGKGCIAIFDPKTTMGSAS